jgi:hypothetical protein
MLDDLLDGPCIGIAGWAKLGLAGVQGTERGCYFTLKSLKDRVHRTKPNYTVAVGGELASAYC